MSDTEAIRRSLITQVTGPIDWVAVCRRLCAVSSGPFVEVGPRRVLSGLLRRIERDAVCHDTSGPARIEQTIANLLRSAVPPVERAADDSKLTSGVGL